MSAAVPKVTQGQIVAATLRQVASQLHKLADMLDADATKGQPIPKKQKPESLRALWKQGML